MDRTVLLLRDEDVQVLLALVNVCEIADALLVRIVVQVSVDDDEGLDLVLF